jgi:hypothetical protein
MSRLIVDDPDTLRGVITQLGSTVIPGETFRFDLPRGKVRDVIPKINKLGLGVRTIRERREQGQEMQTIMTLELYRPDNKLTHIPEW